MQKLAILGATGTIGQNTLDVVSRHPERYRVGALSAHSNVEEMISLCRAHKPDYAVMSDPECAGQLRQALSSTPEITVLGGLDGLLQVASDDEIDQVVAGIVGAAGLLPVLEALKHGKRVLLANKEPLVMAGAIVMATAREHDAEIIPLDSEHNAVFQCLPTGYRAGERCAGVSRVLLTASGGPFRQTPLEELSSVTPEQAVAHPNWTMGQKISVDSATMMNKGLELIEAIWLFNLRPDQVDVVLHPQSIVHSFVEYEDSSVLAQLGQPDMRTPIAQALGYPERIASGVTPLALQTLGQLDFEPVSLDRYPCLAVAQEAARQGGQAPNVLNAANEVAVSAFLSGRIAYPDIHRVISIAMEQYTASEVASVSVDELDAVLEVDQWARQIAGSMIDSLKA